MSDYTIEVGKRIRNARKNANMSMKELGSKVGLSESTISKYEKGVIKSLDTELLEKIADVLDVSANYLSGWNKKVVDLISGSESVRESMEKSDLSDNTYYINKDTREIAQEIFENKELRLLFDTARDSQPEDLETVHQMLLALKRKERGNED